jgi:hypothetical protein
VADGGARAPAGAPPPPLAVWGIVAGILLVAFLLPLFPYLRNHVDAERAFRGACANRIADFTARCDALRSPEPRIVAVGGSLLACATRFDEAMDDLSRREGDGEIRFLRLARVWSSIDQFLPVKDRIFAARPDVLLIDAEILTYRMKPATVSNAIHEYAEYCRQWIKLLLKGGGHRQITENQPDRMALLGAEVFESPVIRDARLFSWYRGVIVNREPRGLLPPGDPILALLYEARNRGIRVAVLDLPRSRQAADIIPASHRQKAGELRRQLERECGVRFLDYPRQLPLAMFRDYSHLSATGAELYSRWLLARVSAMLREGGGR